jgi:hypothetical protein
VTIPVIKTPSTHNNVMFPQSARLPTYCPTENMVADILTNALLKWKAGMRHASRVQEICHITS